MILITGILPKYIRTKDEIYDLISNTVSSVEYDQEMGAYNIYYFDKNKGKHLEQNGKGGRSMDRIWNADIVAQANTIRELCDVYICERMNEKGEELPPMIVDDVLIWPAYTVAIYGAIWTRGNKNKLVLKTVAKMNQDGWFELI